MVVLTLRVLMSLPTTSPGPPSGDLNNFSALHRFCAGTLIAKPLCKSTAFLRQSPEPRSNHHWAVAECWSRVAFATNDKP